MILAGPGVPAGKVSATPVTLVDVAPTLYAAADPAVLAREAAGLPGRSLLELAAAPDDTERCAFAEYHAVGAVTGCFMLRRGRWKYLHYEGYPGQLFDLESDPDELVDLAGDPSCAAMLGDMERRLREIVDPAEATARAFDDQRRVIEANGGEEGVLRRGEFPHTPAPGEAPSFFDAVS
jgi:choline-sulfatase